MRLFDLHCDTLYECVTKNWSFRSHPGHVDGERSDLFDVYGQVFAAWIPDSVRGEDAWRLCCALLDRAEDEEARSGGKLRICRDTARLDPDEMRGHCTAVLSVEGGAAIGGHPECLRLLAKRGVKLMTITWNGENEWGYGSLSGDARGLKLFGKQAVRELERCGIVPDVSHLNERGFWDVAELCERPFAATHSLSAAVHAHPRNLTDAQFREMVRRGGLVGLCLAKEHLGEQTPEGLERHLEHFWSLGGEHTVALGGDMDGTALPEGFGGLRFWLQFYEYLLCKNYKESLLSALFFGNCTDFLRRL